MTGFQFLHQPRTFHRSTLTKSGEGNEIQLGVWVLKTFVRCSSNRHSSAAFPEKKTVKTGSDPPSAEQNPPGRISWEKKAPWGIPCKNRLISPRGQLQKGWTGDTGSRSQTHCGAHSPTSAVIAKWWMWGVPLLCHSPPAMGTSRTTAIPMVKRKRDFFSAVIYTHLALDWGILQHLIRLPLSASSDLFFWMHNA